MRILSDTNILARLAHPAHPHHDKAVSALAAMRERGDDPCVVPQVVYEFWVVCTRPPGENGLGMSIEEAEAEISRIKRLFLLYRDERAIFQEWERLVTEYITTPSTSSYQNAPSEMA